MSAEPPGQGSAAVAGNQAAAGQPEAKEGDGFRLRVSKDRMKIYLDCDTEGKDFEALAEAILNRLLLFGVRKPPTLSDLREWLRTHAGRSSLIEMGTLLEGTPPVEPVDGRIEWAGDFFNPGFLIDEETGRINFRKRAGERNVKESQLLATIIPAVPGKNGIDVTGEVIRVRKPRSARVRLGVNVREDPAGPSYYATRDGRFRWDKELLAVDELYEVKGDVGLETGDISHQGAVLVHKDVLEGARLEAQGDIEILGIVDRAHVQCGGMLKVHGGITGGEGTRVIASGGIRAKYILDAHVMSNGDIVVEKEIMHSEIMTLGALFVPQGRIAGGHVTALCGIDVGQAGSAGSAPTSLTAGEDFSLEGQIAILRNRLHQRQVNVERIHHTIAGVRGKIASLPKSSKDAIRTLLGKLPAMEASIANMKEEIEAARAASRARARHLILIRRQIFPETRLTVKGETFLAREEVQGPVRPVYTEGRLRLAYTNLRSITRSDQPETLVSTDPESEENKKT